MKNFFKKHKKKILIIFFCFALSFSFLLVTSKNSFLYTFNDWVDANAFFTMGRSMMNGLVPYQDLFEQKGIFLYLIYGIGYLFSATTFHGVFILEVLFGTVFLYYAFLIVELFLKRKYAFVILPIFMFLLCTSKSFVHGGSAEEFCLPFFCISLYYFIRHFKKKELSYKNLVFLGGIAGVILLTKYTLLGFWILFMFLLFIDMLSKKQIKTAFQSCLIFLLGMSIPIIIALIYLGYHGAIDDFYEVYFKINITAYSETSVFVIERIISMFKIFYEGCFKDRVAVSMLLVLFPLLVCLLNEKRSFKISLILLYAGTFLGIFYGLIFFDYYLLPMFIFLLISLIIVFWLLEIFKCSLPNGKKMVIIALVVNIVCLILTYRNASYGDYRKLKKNDYFQYRFANIINKEKNATLLNMGALDCGLYTTAGILPSTYFFEKQNILYENFPDNLDAFQDYIKNKKTMYIVYVTIYEREDVVNEEKNLVKHYDLIEEASQLFEGETIHAFLFRRK